MAATRTPAGSRAGGAVTATENATTALGTTAGTGSRSAPGRIAGAVWPALEAGPGGTAAMLASAAGVSVVTARRALRELEAAGYAARTPGGRVGGKRAADTWHPAASTGPATDAGTAEGGPLTTGDSPASETSTGGPQDPARLGAAPHAGPADAGRGDEATGGGEAGKVMEEAAVTEAGEGLTALAAVVASAAHALQAGDRSAVLAAAESIYRDSGRVRRLIKAVATPRPRGASGRARAFPGQMRAKVAAHLAAHPGVEFTPHEIAKVIGHSPGAVANALDKLTELGHASLSCDRPRRFTSTATVSSSATTGTDARASTTQA